MIRARAGKLLLLGLDATNVQRLQLGQPIVINRVEVDNGQPIETVFLCYGPTMRDVVDQMKAAGALPPDFVYEESKKPVPPKKRH